MLAKKRLNRAMRRRRERGDDVERRAIDQARHPLAAFLQAEADQLFDRAARGAGLLRALQGRWRRKSISASA